MSIDSVIDEFRKKRWENAKTIIIKKQNTMKYRISGVEGLHTCLPEGIYHYVFLDPQKERMELKSVDKENKKSYIVEKWSNTTS